MRTSVRYVLILHAATLAEQNPSSVEITNHAHVLRPPRSSLLQTEIANQRNTHSTDEENRIHASKTQAQEEVDILRDRHDAELSFFKGKTHAKHNQQHALSPNQGSLVQVEERPMVDDTMINPVLAGAEKQLELTPNDLDVAVRMEQKHKATDALVAKPEAIDEGEAHRRHIFIFATIFIVVAGSVLILACQCFTLRCLRRIAGAETAPDRKENNQKTTDSEGEAESPHRGSSDANESGTPTLDDNGGFNKSKQQL